MSLFPSDLAATAHDGQSGEAGDGFLTVNDLSGLAWRIPSNVATCRSCTPKSLQLNKARLKTWDGRYPTFLMGTGGEAPSMLL